VKMLSRNWRIRNEGHPRIILALNLPASRETNAHRVNSGQPSRRLNSSSQRLLFNPMMLSNGLPELGREIESVQRQFHDCIVRKWSRIEPTASSQNRQRTFRT
jgi:hypothetical protein